MELRYYVALLWRWLWLIVLAALVAAGAAFLISRQSPRIYQASTTLLIRQAQQSNSSDYYDLITSERLSSTYVAWLRTRPVMQEVIALLGLDMAADELAGAVDVEYVRETQLLVLSVTDTNPLRAAAIANTVPQVFSRQSQALQTSRYAESKVALTQQLDSLEEEITRTQARIDELRGPQEDDSAESDRLQADLRALQANYTIFFQSLGDLRLEEASSIDALYAIEEALPPAAPIRPRPMQNAFLAGIIGAMLAVGAVVLVEYLDDVLKNPDMVKTALDLATLGAIPASVTAADASEIVVLQPGQSSGTEAFRVLRTNLQFASVGQPLLTLLITSPAPSEGKSWTAANLGAVLAQSGQRVVLIDADLHRPRQHRIFKLPNNVGLTTALLAVGDEAEKMLQDGDVPGLRVLTSGPLPPNAAELLGSARMSSLLASLAEVSDVVIIDSPPATALADTAILATKTDGVLMVLDATKTRREVAERALEGLRRVQARVIGVVLNRMPTRGSGYYYYYYHYSHYDNSDNGRDGRDARRGKLRRMTSRAAKQKTPARPS